MALIPPERGEQVVADLQARFDRVDVPYKTVNNTAINTAIFVPKTISSAATATTKTTVPVLVHFHGGALLVGTYPEPFFLTDWVRDLAHSTPAIFVSPGYRLAPEARGVEILDDVADFWTWLHAHLPAAVAERWPHLAPDLARIVAVGESAGGFLTLQSAFLFNHTARIRTAVALYPAMYLDLPAFSPRAAEPVPAWDALVADYLKDVAAHPGTVRVSTPWPEKVDLLSAGLGNGLMRELLGEDPEGKLTLKYALEKAEEVPPPVWVVQGTEDVIIPKPATDELVERIAREKPKATVKYTVQPGGHGFDGLNTIKDEWVREGVEFVKGYWL